MARHPLTRYLGDWRIAEVDEFERDYLDLVVPAHITIEKKGLGILQFGVVNCDLDCRVEEFTGLERLAFSFFGMDEDNEVLGRGWAVLEGERLTGKIYFHRGDEFGFVAKRRTSSGA